MHRVRLHQLVRHQRLFRGVSTAPLPAAADKSSKGHTNTNSNTHSNTNTNTRSHGTTNTRSHGHTNTRSHGTTNTRSHGHSGSDGSVSAGGAALCVAPGPYRRVGNLFVVHCADHPFKHAWEVNRMLRDLRLEFRGQTAVHPDTPAVRQRLWRVRHVVQVDMMDLDEAKALIGVPAHMQFADLAAQIPVTFGRVRAVQSPVIRSKMNFMRLRRMRLRDVLHRDALELRLLEERRKALAAAEGTQGSVKSETATGGVETEKNAAT